MYQRVNYTCFYLEKLPWFQWPRFRVDMLSNHSWFLCCWAVQVGPGSEASWAEEGVSQLMVQATNTANATQAGGKRLVWDNWIQRSDGVFLFSVPWARRGKQGSWLVTTCFFLKSHQLTVWALTMLLLPQFSHFSSCFFSAQYINASVTCCPMVEDVFLALDGAQNCNLPCGQSMQGLVWQLMNSQQGGGGPPKEECQLFSVLQSRSLC